ncbi:hypothetical protein NFI96_022159, partial [Prochilodus magdalenae]
EKNKRSTSSKSQALSIVLKLLLAQFPLKCYKAVSEVIVILAGCAGLSGYPLHEAPKRISGAEVEMRVRPGDNVVLYSVCVVKAGVTVWFRNGSNEDQTPLRISGDDLKQGACSPYAFVWNHYNKTQDLLVKNVTESDLGLYYCARLDPEIIGGRLRDVYYYGNRTSRLSLLGEKKDSEGQSQNQENQKRTKCSEGGGADGGADGGDGVVYTLVNITSRGQNRLKKNRVELSDIFTVQDQHARLYDGMQRWLARYSYVWNSSSSTHDLQVKNVSESDLGLYYCALREKMITEGKAGGGVQKDVYRYGNRTTRLSFLGETTRSDQLSLMQYTQVEEMTEERRTHTGHTLTSSFQQTLQSDTGGVEGVWWMVGVCCETSKLTAMLWAAMGNRNVPLMWTNQISAHRHPLQRPSQSSAPPAPVSEMERSRAVLITLMCVLSSRISGAEVEMRVRPGDSVTLYCDCVWKVGFTIVWFRNCSHHHQPPLMIAFIDSNNKAPPRYSAVWNLSNRTHDLLVKNVSESDLGLYYCALYEKKIIRDSSRVIRSEDVYHYGNRTTRLSLLDAIAKMESSLLTPRLEVKALTVRTVKEKNQRQREKSPNQQIRTREEVGGGDVCYAALDLPSRGQKPLKKKKRRVECSEFSTYSEMGVSGLVKVEELIQDLI